MRHSPNGEDQQVVQFGTYEGLPPKYRGITTQSTYVPMRDGVRLAVEVVLPGGLPSGERVPALLSQTRYWRAIELRAPFKWFLRAEDLIPELKGFQPFFCSHGYALVTVDVRGTGASFGICPHAWPEESFEDARQIVDWIVAQPWSDGQVGGYGISYVGTTAELLAALDHPAVKCTIPMFNHPDAYIDIAFPGGIFEERFIKAWTDFNRDLDRSRVPEKIGLLGRLLAKGVKPVDGDQGRALLREAIGHHAANGDAYQMVGSVVYRDQPMAGSDSCVDDLAVHRYKDEIQRSPTAILGWGSWMDAGTADAVIRRFLTYDTAHRAVIGAWEHGGRFHASPYQPSNPSGRASGRSLPADPELPGQWREMLRFFDAHLKRAPHLRVGPNPQAGAHPTGEVDEVLSEKVLFYYTLGEERWKRTGVWPPQGTTQQRWYLVENQALSPDAPESETGSDTFTVDFEASTGNYNRWWEMNSLEHKTVAYGDRAEAGRHMLTYTSPPLAGDTEITGYPVVTLYVTSTETDGAFYVYLGDVAPSGCVTYVTEGQLRAIHRQVSTRPPPYCMQVPYHTFKAADARPLVPGQVAELSFGLLPTSVLIRKGHRIQVGIAGHDAGTFVRVPAQGTPVITLARNQRYASYLDLPVVRRMSGRNTG
jgi:putative CocE/NonD family hydrolase